MLYISLISPDMPILYLIFHILHYYISSILARTRYDHCIHKVITVYYMGYLCTYRYIDIYFIGMVHIYNIPSQYIIILIMITYISQVDHISSHIIVNQAISPEQCG